MKLKQFADFFQEFFSLWSDFGVVPGKNMCIYSNNFDSFSLKSIQVSKRSKIQKQFCKIVSFHEKFILKIADLLSFATEICFDFCFCRGRGKRFQVLKPPNGIQRPKVKMNKMHCGHFLLTRAHYCHAVENVLHHAYWQERFRWWCESESGPDLLKVPIFVHLAIASRPPDQDFELPKISKINKSLS